MEELKRYFDLQLFADDDEDKDDDSDAADEDGGKDPDDNDDNKDQPKNKGTDAGDTGDDDKDDGKAGKTLTQDEVNAIIQKRLKRERKKWEDEQAEAERKKKLTEEERLKEEKAEAEKKAKAAEEKANKKLITAEALLVAQELGIEGKAAIKLADFSDVEIDEDGKISGVKEALQAALTEYPILKKTPQKPGVGAGTNPGTNTGNEPDPDIEKLGKMSMDEYIAWREKKKKG